MLPQLLIQTSHLEQRCFVMNPAMCQTVVAARLSEYVWGLGIGKVQRDLELVDSLR
jgi:hypothetical protein